MERRRQYIGGCAGAVLSFVLSASAAWGYFFDDRREMSLAGFAYSRGTIATADGIASADHTWQAGNLVQHRNFLTLEWRHNLNRVSRDLPTLGSAFQFLNFDSFDYSLNLRTEYDGVWDYGPHKMRRAMGGARRQGEHYFDDPRTATPFDGAYFTPGAAPDFPADFISLTNRRWLRDFRGANVRLFEWYFNITKGPLFIRIGRQNLSWGETDAFRLLDQINPLDNSFAGFLTSLDERRIPLNMLRAQWSFGTVGPIQDLALEGFYSVDDEVQQPGLPTSSTNFWGSIQNGNSPVMLGRQPCGSDFMAKRGMPAYNEDPLLPYHGTGPGPNRGGGCSISGSHPKSNLADGRGGVRILGTIRDFSFSIAHFYTYQDRTVIRATVLSPTRDHLRWDLGLPTDSQGRAWQDNIVDTPLGRVNTANPWGVADPFAARMISSGANPFGRGAIGTLGGAERNITNGVNYQRVQVTGGTLSFPISALTSLFVDSSSPLFYLYTTVRMELAYTRNVPTPLAYAHGDATTAFSRFLGTDLPGTTDASGPVFGPGGVFADQVGRRGYHLKKIDHLAWNVGLDHIQWIRWLNKNNSFIFSAQQFWQNRNGQDTSTDAGRQPSVLNDRVQISGRQRARQKPITDTTLANFCASGSGSRRGCSLWKEGGQDLLTTFVVSTNYMAGNLTPRFAFFYDWSGSYLMQPGIDWKFWDPFRLSLRYNFIEGRGNAGLGILNKKDNVWLELQYLLY